MEINIEDNVHKLRLRLIDSVGHRACVLVEEEVERFLFKELHHQRRSTDEYIKRTRMFLVGFLHRVCFCGL